MWSCPTPLDLYIQPIHALFKMQVCHCIQYIITSWHSDDVLDTVKPVLFHLLLDQFPDLGCINRSPSTLTHLGINNGQFRKMT